MLTELDPSMSLSDGLRMELMLELSGLSRQEVLVVKACAATKDFEGVAKVLVVQFSGIHLREGSKSWLAAPPHHSQENLVKGMVIPRIIWW